VTTLPNPESTVDPASFTVRRSVFIAATREKVWAAVTEPEHLTKWWCTRAEFAQLAAGTEGYFAFDGYGNLATRIEEVDPPNAVSYRWGQMITDDNADDDHFAQSTVFRFTLDEVEGGTLLTVVESGFETLTDPSRSMDENRDGWNTELDELVAYLDGAA